VSYGETTTLSWTLDGVASSLILDGVSVLGESSRTVTPARRQTYLLAAANALGGETRSVTVAARGIDLLAGDLGGKGTLDGTGDAARFMYPWALAADGSGNVYVADTGNHTLRKVTRDGMVSTLAGSAGMPGSADGTGSNARFYWPSGVTVDGSGNIYVADTWNHLVRKVTPAGVVTTLAGSAGVIGSADGTGSAARFNFPRGVATDSSGNVYVSDTSNHILRKITPAGAVTTIAGSSGVIGAIPGRLPGSLLLPQAIALTPSRCHRHQQPGRSADHGFLTGGPAWPSTMRHPLRVA